MAVSDKDMDNYYAEVGDFFQGVRDIPVELVDSTVFENSRAGC
jgi:hypothetical protein